MKVNISIATAEYFLFLFVVNDVEMVCILSEFIVSLVLVNFVYLRVLSMYILFLLCTIVILCCIGCSCFVLGNLFIC